MNATIQDIAKKVGLSISTVSRALSGSYGVHPKTIARVQQAAASLGYVPNLGAKQLVTRKSNLIGVFMPEFDFETNREFDDIFSPLRKAFRLYQKDVLIFSVPYQNYQPNTLSDWVRMRNLEGCVFMPPFSSEHPVIKEALKLQIPTVNFNSSIGLRCSSVVSDDYEGGRLAGAFLIEQGHSLIGYLDGPRDLKICEDRYKGFCEVLLDEAAIKHNPAHVVNGDFSGASGAKGIMDLLNRAPELTAICCANDLMAMGAIMELARNGITVPRDISLIGYDGSFFTAFSNPPLTTIRHRFEWIGTRAAELLIEVLNGGIGRCLCFAPELVQRDSVGPPTIKET
ncbi:MAG: LacI family transcriptional regulator [Gorillibacterium sp.]|nr:LacI family transcriptional regulator [Gorillibacterium sp.]